MKDICLQGYNSRYITMQADSKMEPGDLVVMSGNNTVKKAAAGKFVGVAHAVRGEYVLVQTGGFAVLPYSGTAPTVGFATLAADSNADATASASGREVLVTEVDATAKTVGSARRWSAWTLRSSTAAPSLPGTTPSSASSSDLTSRWRARTATGCRNSSRPATAPRCSRNMCPERSSRVWMTTIF